MTCLLRGTSRKIGRGCAARFLKPLPYFRPKSVIFSTLFQTWSKIWYPISELKPWSPERVTSCYCTYTVVGVNIKRGMVLTPNDEEVANCFKSIPNLRLECTNHTPFQTRTAKKNTPFGAAHTYIAYIRDYPRPAGGGGEERKTRCRLWVSLLTQARLIKEGRIFPI